MECGCTNKDRHIFGIISVLIILVTGCSAQYTNCYAFGTEHILTFDNARIDFSSACQFEMAYTCPPSVVVPAQFRVNIQNVMVDQVSIVDCVEVLYEDFSVTLCRDQTATYDGSVVDTLIAANGELMVYTGTAGKEVAIYVADSVTDENIYVTLTPSGMVRVSVPDTYGSRMCGLCGNFNGDAADDLQTSDGVDVAAEQYDDRGAMIAGSHLLPTPNDLNCQTAADVMPLNVSDCKYVSTAIESDIENPLNCGVYNLGLSTTFQSCIVANRDLQAMFASLCEYDFCENYLTMTDPDTMSSGDCYITGDCVYNETEAKVAINRIAEVFIDECRARGVEISNWRTDYGADLTCSSNSVYDFSGDKCPDVCGLPSDRCTQSNREGCVCQTDYYRDGAEDCVEEPECGCADTVTGAYYMTDDTWLDSTCSTQFICYGSGNITMSSVSCSDFAECTIVDGSYQCVCTDGYAGTGFVCEISCPAGEQPTADMEGCEECRIGYYQPDADQDACLPCDPGLVTLQLGSTDVSDCQEIIMLADADLVIGNGECVTDVYDSAYRFVVPSNVLPDGLPFGLRSYTSFYPSTNGLIAFGRAFVGRDPVSAGLTGDEFSETVAAPYWFRQDLRRLDEANQDETKLCMSAYNVIDDDSLRAEESQVLTSIIRIMLSASPTIDTTFTPTYAFVATWYKSFAFPYVWYDAETIETKEYATYQAVVATDGVRTYLMYVYPSGSNNTQLRRLNEFRNIYMGYDAQDGETSFSLYLSTTTEIVGLHTEPSNTDKASRWVFDVADRGEPNPYAEACIAWYSEQQSISQGITLVSGLVCPCSSWQARYDERFFFDYNSNCALSLYPSQGYYLTCCYNPINTALITDPRLAGYRSIYNQLLHPSQYYSNDQLPFENCCAKSDHCTLFRTYRPVESCSLYTPPQLCAGFGEPHIYTLDGHLYTFNPVGEFWMIKSESLSMQSRMVQWVNPSTNDAVQATQFQAFAMRSNVSGTLSDEIHLELNNNRTDFIMYKNKVSITPSILIENSLTPFTGGTIKNFNESITVSFDTGHTFRFSLGLSILSVQSLVPQTEKGKVLGLLGTYNDDLTDDITAADGSLVCNVTVCTDKEDIHDVFGESYRITVDESLFWYRYTWDTATYTDINFQPIYLDMNQVDANNQTVVNNCNNDAACIYDTIVTDNADIGTYTSNVQAEVMSSSEILLNKAPIVEGMKKLEVMVGQAVTATYTFSDPDPGQTARLVVKSSPPGAVIVEDANSMTLTWTPTDTEEVTLSMYAEEENTIDAPFTSEELNVEFYVAQECQNGAIANFTVLAPGGTVTPLFYRVVCDCLPGWEGDVCDIDIDGCADDPCYLANCTDIPASQADTAEYICTAQDCPVGFNRTDGRNETIDECFDIDECILDMPCELSLCVNTLGSYYCNCPTGFVQEEDGNCTDIDECALRVDECTDICTNTEGDYDCSCYPGGTLRASDNQTCDILISNTLCGGLYNCSYSCLNETTGECGCPRTLTLDPADNQTCILLDECLDPALNGCDSASNATCEDLDSGYKCNCPTGYIISDNQYICEECPIGTYGERCINMCHCEDRAKECNNIQGCTDCNPGWEGDQCLNNTDECAQPDICPDNSQCVDTSGSYQCVCDDGFRYVLNGSIPICENINECLELSQPCSVNADCEDLIGSAKYTCTCLSGYEGDGQTCSNINECLLDVCDASAIRCEDEVPGFSCICRVGAQGDGKINGTKCTDVNECKDAINACPANNSICTNTDPSYMCSCAEYYTGDGYTECIDIDECALNGTEALCGTIANGIKECINLEPSYECDTECDDGYVESVDNSGITTCENIDECFTDPSSTCPGDLSTCVDTPGSYECVCPEGYVWESPNCVDIDECLPPNEKCGDKEICENLSPNYTCSCFPGYFGESCERNDTVTFLTVDQVLDLQPQVEWSDPNSTEYYVFINNFIDTLQPLFNSSDPGFIGIRILNVQEGDDPTHTKVTYEVVYNPKPTDLEHQTFYNLKITDYELTYDNQTIRDLGQIQFDNRTWSCSDITCMNNFTCSNDEDYPYCTCSGIYSGYNCGLKATIVPGTDPIGNLLPLWISVAVASALLVVGMCACCMFLLVSYRRRRRRREQPPVHRHAVRVAGPAIFNPASRVPAEAYNYQFPRGSIRSSISDDSMRSDGYSSRTGATSRVGSSVPFAPRWPRAYYSQLADLTDG